MNSKGVVRLKGGRGHRVDEGGYETDKGGRGQTDQVYDRGSFDRVMGYLLMPLIPLPAVPAAQVPLLAPMAGHSRSLRACQTPECAFLAGLNSTGRWPSSDWQLEGSRCGDWCGTVVHPSKPP